MKFLEKSILWSLGAGLGDEERLLDCPRGRRHHRACNHSRDVGLVCGKWIHIPIVNSG